MQCPHRLQPLVHLGVLLQVTEIYNFDQDDLMTEDIFILDCQSEIYVWVGQQVNSKNRLQALTIAKVQINENLFDVCT